METPSKSHAIVKSDLPSVFVKEAGEGVKAYHIFLNPMMKQMSERIPRILEELRDIDGIDDVKLNKYGARVLETIKATIMENAEAFENHSNTNDGSDSVKRKRDQVEGNEVFVESLQTSGRQSSDMETPSKPQTIIESDFAAKLFTALQKLRKVLVKEAGEGVVAYHIFPNATMKQMCERIPRTLEELRDIRGIGNVKLNKYGARVLETIEATIMENAEAFEKHSISNGTSDTLKRKRDEAEGDGVFVESSQTSGTPNSKMETPSKSQVVGSDFRSKLYTALRKLRTDFVKEAGEGVIAYHIFQNITLTQMCEKIPRTLEALRDIRGLGNVKVNKYGARVLETIEATITENSKAYENDTNNNDRVEGDEILVESSHTTGRSSSKMETPSKPQVVESNFSAKLYTALRNLRSVLLEEAGKGVMAYHIFTNATLKLICEKVPRTLEELLGIHGISNRKVNEYGARVLETIEATIKENAEANKHNSSSYAGSDSAK